MVMKRQERSRSKFLHFYYLLIIFSLIIYILNFDFVDLNTIKNTYSTGEVGDTCACDYCLPCLGWGVRRELELVEFKGG